MNGWVENYDQRFPRGWFLAAASDEVEKGRIISLTYFERDFIAFRTKDGRAVMLDAHCPHLGAHIGVGGKIEGDCVRCPFHGWLYDAKGACVEIPYNQNGRIPKRAHLRAWPVEEKAGGIFFWHDPQNNPPDFFLPDIPQYDDRDWVPWQIKKTIVKTHPLEVIDNITDKAHFPVVHFSPVDQWENIFDQHRVIQKQQGPMLKTTATYHGPGYLLTELHQKEGHDSLMLVCHTPVNDKLLHMWSGVMLKQKGKNRSQEACKEAATYTDFLTTGFLQDVSIWEHKTGVSKPILCDGDGPIAQGRRWYEQFYKSRNLSA